MNKEKRYAGIGSRETPDHILELMTQMARLLAARGYVLHSGGAGGADEAFEKGCPANDIFRRIYLPWEGFQSKKSGRGIIVPHKSSPVWAQAEQIAAKYHPAWTKLSQAAQKLMTRNVYQVLGDDLQSPVNMVLCWSKSISWDKKKGLIKNVAGGTGQAVRLAYDQGIPVYHLGVPEHVAYLKKICNMTLECEDRAMSQPEPEAPSASKNQPTGRWIRTPKH